MSESKSQDRNVTAAPVPGAEGIGNALSSGIVTTPDELLRAIARQARMPMVRIGEALVSLGMITPEQLTEALSRQQLDRRVPVGELLVNSGAVSRAELQIALRRKMGYPLSTSMPSSPSPRPCASSATPRRSGWRSCRCWCTRAGWSSPWTIRPTATAPSTRPSSTRR